MPPPPLYITRVAVIERLPVQIFAVFINPTGCYIFYLFISLLSPPTQRGSPAVFPFSRVFFCQRVPLFFGKIWENFMGKYAFSMFAYICTLYCIYSINLTVHVLKYIQYVVNNIFYSSVVN